MSMPTLDNKVALVTGASRSLGFHIAAALIGRGARVIVTGRDAGALAAAAGELGPAAMALTLDVRSPASVRAVFARAFDRFGRLDILVNNAAAGYLHRIDEASDEHLQAEMETNLLGVMYCIRAAVPLMRGQGGGDIVSVSSESVLLPFPLLSTYAASKAAVECLSAGLRDELRPDNIRISVLRSGNIADSGFGDHWPPAARQEAFALWKSTGHLAMAGAGVRPGVIAATVADMVSLPAGAGIDLLAVRGR
jgi:meso-butanediol dehydrogenase / (S,S)-butanediol dehydrogenase / diacetyl reductase